MIWDFRVEELAKRKGVSMAQISTAWIMNRPGVTAPIVGTTSLKNLEDILGACAPSFRSDLEHHHVRIPEQDSNHHCTGRCT